LLIADTHAVLWWLADDALLPDSTRELIGDPSAAVYASAASVWEIAIKRSLGKLEVADGWFEALQEDFEPLSITAAHARRAGALPQHHTDPFDRMVIAQALEEGLTIVTADAAFNRYDVPTAW
jgi:PIN domain nuclease of toxin-antitoxin system